MTIPELAARRDDLTLSVKERTNAAAAEVSAYLKLSAHALPLALALRGLLRFEKTFSSPWKKKEVAAARAALAPVEHLLPKE